MTAESLLMKHVFLTDEEKKRLISDFTAFGQYHAALAFDAAINSVVWPDNYPNKEQYLLETFK